MSDVKLCQETIPHVFIARKSTYSEFINKANVRHFQNLHFFGLRRVFRSPSEILPSFTSYNLRTGAAKPCYHRGNVLNSLK